MTKQVAKQNDDELLDNIDEILDQLDAYDEGDEGEELEAGDETIDEDAEPAFNARSAIEKTFASIRGSGKKQTPTRKMDKRNPESTNLPIPAPKFSKEDVDVSSDIKAVFSNSGLDLSEEFKTKATDLFETAVVSLVNQKLEELTEQYEESFNGLVAEHVEEISEKVDSYLEYVVEQWMADNSLAIERGIRAEITEDFIVGLKNLFTEHYIEIPEEKLDVTEELADKVEELERMLDTAITESATYRDQVETFTKISIVDELSNDLTESQVEKLCSLAEAVDFVSEEDFKKKVSELKTTYFPNSKGNVTEEKSEKSSVEDTSVITEETETKGPVDPAMDAVLKTLDRTIKNITV